MVNSADVLDRTFAALADPTRRAMVDRLVRGPAGVSELAAPFDMSLPAVLKHVGVLEDAGLVACEKRGRVRVCRLDVRAMDRAIGWVERRRLLWQSRLDRLGRVVQEGRDA